MDYPIFTRFNQLGENPNKALCIAAGILLPLGLPIYIFAVYRRKVLLHDLRQTGKVSEELKDIILNFTHTNSQT
jgi:hypothetical protein